MTTKELKSRKIHLCVTENQKNRTSEQTSNWSLGFTFWLGLRLEAKLQGEVGALTEPVTGEREDGLQQDQTRLKVRSDGVFCHAGQSEAEKEPRVGLKTFPNQREMPDCPPEPI